MITSRRAFLKTTALGGASLVIAFDLTMDFTPRSRASPRMYSRACALLLAQKTFPPRAVN